MTAHQIIDSALELDTESSMLQLIKAEKDLRMIGDFIIGGSLDEQWVIAIQHVRQLKEDQNKAAVNGQIIRIM